MKAHAGGADEAAVRVSARLERCEDVRIAAGLQDEVDLGVTGEFVEATVGPAADAVNAGECDPRGRGIRVEHIADLDPGDAEERPEYREARISCAHQGDDVRVLCHPVLSLFDVGYDSWAGERVRARHSTGGMS